jgi:hypothetical protein
VETNSADVICSPDTPLDRGAPAVTPGPAESARSVTELFTEHHLVLVRLAVLMVMATFRDVPSGSHRGTVIVQIAEVSAAGSGPVRVLHTVIARYTVNTQGYLNDTSQVLALDPTGRYALVQGFQFGWLDLDLGRFTPLPPYTSLATVYGVVQECQELGGACDA